MLSLPPCASLTRFCCTRTVSFHRPPGRATWVSTSGWCSALLTLYVSVMVQRYSTLRQIWREHVIQGLRGQHGDVQRDAPAPARLVCEAGEDGGRRYASPAFAYFRPVSAPAAAPGPLLPLPLLLRLERERAEPRPYPVGRGAPGPRDLDRARDVFLALPEHRVVRDAGGRRGARGRPRQRDDAGALLRACCVARGPLLCASIAHDLCLYCP